MRLLDLFNATFSLFVFTSSLWFFRSVFRSLLLLLSQFALLLLLLLMFWGFYS